MHTHSIHIRFSDIDAMGHVNNAVYFTYFEQGRIAFFDSLLGTEIKYAERGVIVASAHCNYKIPVRFRDQVEVKTWCSRIGTKSFDVSYSIGISNNGHVEEAANGVTTMVCFDYKTNSSIQIPEGWKEKLTQALILGK